MLDFTDEDVQLAVKHGANWLDETHPDWVNRIDLNSLVMSNCDYCVIGQAVGDYYELIARASRGCNEAEWAIGNGFQAPNFYSGLCNEADRDAAVKRADQTMTSYYTKLEVLWTDEVKKRLG